MVWLTLGSYLLMSLHNGYLKQVLFNHNFRCLYIIIMHDMDQKLLFYLLLMIVYIGIQMKILENSLLILWERDSMWTFLGYAHWFMSISIYQLKDYSISVDQARYATSIVVKYLDTATVKVSKKVLQDNISRWHDILKRRCMYQWWTSWEFD